MWMKWFPWRFVVSRIAQRQGFIDPIALLSRLHRFAQPSEVTEPIELLRAGVVFHARGLINARSIQHNLDWVWPHWVERQFDPRDPAFVPRAFSITHVNLTHRNWTAVGLPESDWYPIVDPRGLVTPLYDSWSLDAWVIPADSDAEALLPSRGGDTEQRLQMNEGLAVNTRTSDHGHRLESQVDMVNGEAGPECRVRYRAESRHRGWLVLSLRPANPEGISFIHDIETIDGGGGLCVDGEANLRFDRAPERIIMSHYRNGDVHRRLTEREATERERCEIGLATAAALFPLGPDEPAELEVRVPFAESSASQDATSKSPRINLGPPRPWAEATPELCRARLPDAHYQFLFDAAVRTVILHAPGEVYPGPYTYKRFWFRDAAFILDALLAIGANDRVERTLAHFPRWQSALGYFHSQEGEWDSNGEALWILERFRRYTDTPLTDAQLKSVTKGWRWIRNKRLDDGADSAHAGLLPAGFSAEHLGPNDYYYWDDFWSAAGLRSAAATLAAQGEPEQSREALAEAERLERAVDRSVERAMSMRRLEGMPASPYRNLDSGAVGSLAAGYPLQLWRPDDPRLLGTTEFLWRHCRVHGGFFQDMIHSRINAYLTLHMAQVLLRAGDPRQLQLVQAVADLASPTGQWPEAIHPGTRGGCMGDGQHVWAAAEWLLLLRNWFVREEDERLLLLTGLPPAWLAGEEPIEFGPAATPYGPVSLRVTPRGGSLEVEWQGQWHEQPPPLRIAPPGFAPVEVDAETGSATLEAQPSDEE